MARQGQISQTEASNPGLAIWVQRSSASSANAARCHSTRLARLACSTITPLGRPVDPDVYTT